jgi:hypothetical protein
MKRVAIIAATAAFITVWAVLGFRILRDCGWKSGIQGFEWVWIFQGC